MYVGAVGSVVVAQRRETHRREQDSASDLEGRERNPEETEDRAPGQREEGQDDRRRE